MNLKDNSEYKELVNLYKTNLLKYQSGPNWCFDMVEGGVDWDGVHYTMERIQEMVDGVSPIGPRVPQNEIIDVTPSYEEYLVIIGPDYDYNKYVTWCNEQKDVFHYSRGKESFFVWEGFDIASNLGYKKVSLENLS